MTGCAECNGPDCTKISTGSCSRGEPHRQQVSTVSAIDSATILDTSLVRSHSSRIPTGPPPSPLPQARLDPVPEAGGVDCCDLPPVPFLRKTLDRRPPGV